MIKLTKSYPDTQIQKIIKLFPNYKTVRHVTTTDTLGNILSIETDNTALINILKSQGFKE